jgi:Holliday junction resolvase RusA-like endonuclease
MCQSLSTRRRRVASKRYSQYIQQIIAEKFPNLEKEMPIQVQEISRAPNRHDQNRTSPQHIIVKAISTDNKERILRAVREKNQIT